MVALKLRLVDQIALRDISADSRPRGFTGEGTQRRRTAGCDAWRGYFRGSRVLITGSAGTGKSILAGAFVEAACLRKEHTLYVSFDENPYLPGLHFFLILAYLGRCLSLSNFQILPLRPGLTWLVGPRFWPIRP